MKALDAFRKTVRALKELGITDPEKEAILAFREILSIDQLVLYRDNPGLTGENLKKLEEFVRRRGQREPLQYIIGHVHFFGLRILVGPGVLIPRPETELLVEAALKRASGAGKLKILDICSGSGAIALALAKNLPDASVTGTDISEKALSYAEKNRALNAVENARFLSGDLFGPVKGLTFDIITANPPYIKDSVIEVLEPEIRLWEPQEALSGGPDGLDVIRRIIGEAPVHLEKGGFLLMEIAGHTDVLLLGRLAGEAGLEPEPVLRDWAGLERVFIAKKTG